MSLYQCVCGKEASDDDDSHGAHFYCGDAYELGAAEERARIVAWLRSESESPNAAIYARAIDRDEHLRGSP